MASTVIDALVVTLGLDASSYTQGQTKARDELARTQTAEKKRTEAAVADSKEMERAAANVVQAYTKIRNEILGLFAVLMAGRGLKEFVTNITTTDAAAGYMARSLGIATDELEAWQTVAERSGGTADGITGSFQKLSQTIANAKLTGIIDQDFAQALDAIGVTLVDPLTNKIKELPKLLLDISGSQKFIQRSAPDRIALGARLGLDAGTVQTLAQNGQGRPALERELAGARQRGVATDADAERAQNLINSFRSIQQSVQDIGRSILQIIGPDLTEALKNLDRYIEDNKEAWKEDFHEAYVRLKDVAGEIDEVVKALGGWQRVTEIVFGLWIGAKFAAAMISIANMTEAIGVGLPGAFTMAGLAAEGFGVRLMAIPAFRYLILLLQMYDKIKNDIDPKTLSPNSPEWWRFSDDVQRQLPNSPMNNPQQDNSWWGSISRWWHGAPNPSAAPGAAPGAPGAPAGPSPVSATIPAEGRAFLDAIVPGESDGTYRDQLSSTGARGRYQFLNSTWNEVAAQTGRRDWTPENQDHNAWFYAQQMFRRNGGPGGDLAAFLRTGGNPAPYLNNIWTSLPGGPEQNRATPGFYDRLQSGLRRQYSEPPATLPGSTPRPPGPQSALVPMPWERYPQVASNQNVSSSQVTIGDINVTTTGANGQVIGRDISNELNRRLATMTANRGLA